MSDDVWIPPAIVAAAKIGLALLTAAWLALDAWLRRRERAHGLRRARLGVLILLGVAGGLGWWSFVGFPVWRTIHEHDGFHYFVGAKYFAELGYDGLYLCTMQVDVEDGLGEGARLRDLASNRLGPAAPARAAAERCRARFSPARWQAFREDVAFFRGLQSREAWQAIRTDHGFNASPAWLIAGAPLANFGPAARTMRTWIWLDHALLVAMWGVVVAVFGVRAACVAAVFWGTNGFSGFDWTGGSLLRHDWLVALVLGLTALRRRHFALAGACLALSTALRVFPGFVLGVVLAWAALEAWRRRAWRPSREALRFAAGAILAGGLALGVSLQQFGPAAWQGFVENSRKHLATPLLNQMGLRPVVAWDAGTRARLLEDPSADDPHALWKELQTKRLDARRPLWIVLVVAWAALLARALRGRAAWEAAALGTGAIPILSALTCYYQAALVGMALLVRERASAGIALCLFAAFSEWTWATIPYSDVPFVRMSVAELATVVFVTARFARRSP